MLYNTKTNNSAQCGLAVEVTYYTVISNLV